MMMPIRLPIEDFSGELYTFCMTIHTHAVSALSSSFSIQASTQNTLTQICKIPRSSPMLGQKRRLSALNRHQGSTL